MSNRIAVPALLLIAGVAAACSRDSKAAGPVQPPSITWIGPQPGPDAPMNVAVNPYSGDRTAIAEGHRLWNSFNCSGCHGDHGGGGMGPSLRDSLWYYGGTEAEIFASIYQGRDKGMPAWGSKLAPRDIWRIVSYIKSMRTANEIDPPR